MAARVGRGCLVCGVLLLAMCVAGCRVVQRRDYVVSSVTNLSHTYRATVLVRSYYADLTMNRSPTTYVLLDPNHGGPGYENGMEFEDSQVLMKPTQCGPLALEWVNDGLLKVRCEKCGLSLTSVGRHAEWMDGVRIEYEGFPEVSSWEGGLRGR